MQFSVGDELWVGPFDSSQWLPIGIGQKEGKFRPVKRCKTGGPQAKLREEICTTSSTTDMRCSVSPQPDPLPLAKLAKLAGAAQQQLYDCRSTPGQSSGDPAPVESAVHCCSQQLPLVAMQLLQSSA